MLAYTITNAGEAFPSLSPLWPELYSMYSIDLTTVNYCVYLWPKLHFVHSLLQYSYYSVGLLASATGHVSTQNGNHGLYSYRLTKTVGRG